VVVIDTIGGQRRDARMHREKGWIAVNLLVLIGVAGTRPVFAQTTRFLFA
jgi:hypothetical protein